MRSQRSVFVLVTLGITACGGSGLHTGDGGGDGRDGAASETATDVAVPTDASADTDAAVVADLAGPADVAPDLGPTKVEPRVASGWHIVNPPPPGGLRTLGRDLTGNTWAVSGENVVRWAGNAWSHVARTPPATLANAWWVGGPGDVWGVNNDGPLVHWDGHDWWQFPYAWAQSLLGVWGTASDDVWVVGGPGIAFHFDGQEWTETSFGDLAGPRSVWGSAANDVWVAGVRDIFHFDGSTWQLRASFPGTLILDLWGLGPNDVWARDSLTGRLFRWDGVAWAERPGATPRAPGAAWSGAPNEEWVSAVAGAQLLWNGQSWSKPDVAPPTTSFTGAWGSSANDVWAVGYGGGIAHWDGARWSSRPSGVTAELKGIWGSGPNDVWIVGAFADRTTTAQGPIWSGVILHWDGTAWTRTDTAKNEELSAVWGSGANDVWAVGTDHRSNVSFVQVIRHWDGVAWSAPFYPDDATGASVLRAVWGSAANDVWAAGSPSLHWDGKTWSRTTDYSRGVWGSGPNDVWTVRHGGASHWNGSAWSDDDWRRGASASGGFGINHPDAVWGSGPNDVHAVGENGDIFHWDGKDWSYELQLGGDHAAVWGSGPGDVWAFGSGGTIVHN